MRKRRIQSNGAAMRKALAQALETEIFQFRTRMPFSCLSAACLSLR